MSRLATVFLKDAAISTKMLTKNLMRSLRHYQLRLYYWKS